ncbi:RNA-dependent RNA polymerase [Yunnan Paris negative-stranded virus]|uniref:RNA-directed RNA polymerase L n=1 Tax=Yunnan Paris negative-stranded virus TaxID=2836142 RepID=A0A8E7DAE3_9VIRU|nr:RNA-dependent RNA polymerase [Yunnan Paris negative-stranded virus]QVU28732.1 RNA-dependent RNA polymerase [Yunnan Paris negative-stranded virus]
MSLRIDSNFSVGSLKVNLTEPELYSCTEFPEPKYECSYDGSNFKIKVNGRERDISVTSEFLRKIRHEVICDVMSFESDTPLRTIGIQGEEGDLSPDFINTEDKTVIEVGSSFISEMFALRNAYTGKIVKYSYLLEALEFSLIALIVSPSRVYTNMTLSQDIVNALCYRARVGIALESVIKDTLGTDIFSEDSSADEAIVKDVFRKIVPSFQSEYDFDLDLIRSMNTLPNEEDFKHTGEVLKECLKRSTIPSSESKVELNSYLSKFETTSRTSDKRVTNIPLVMPKCNYKPDIEIPLDPELANDMPLYLKKIWFSAKEVKPKIFSEEDQFKEAMGEKEYERHRVQKGAAFKVNNLTDDDKTEAAKSGLWAKMLKNSPESLAKEIEDRKSFHPTLTDTTDIHNFINRPLLSTKKASAIPKQALKLMRVGKQVWSKKTPLSLTILEKIASTELVWFCQSVSDMMTEICYSYKYWIKRSDFYHKLSKGVHLLIRCTGDHVFVAYAFPKTFFTSIDVGRIGPTLWESENYIFTDFCSYNEPTIEHFVKAGPYMAAIICHMLSHLEMSLDNLNLVDTVLNQHVNNILLLYLCNKIDCEELITSQRYLTMGLFEELDPNPYRFCERLPEVIRSRLTCYYIKKCINHMEYYAETIITKVPNKENFEYDVKYSGLKSLFGDYEPSLKQKVNEFYFGYVVSKERGRGSDRNFKIMKKIVAEEYRYRDTIKTTFERTLDPKIHVSNPIVIKVFVHIFKQILKSYLGKDYNTVIRTEIIKSMAYTSFEDLATLKVSSRTYGSSIIVPNVSEEMSTSEVRKLYESANPNEKGKRPRVMEALSKLVVECEADTKRSVRHPVELLPYCIKAIQEKGYWDSDIFPKAQHGGDREIHVLEIKMRIIQYFTECISKTLCRLCPSDTLTHPYEKESFVKKHYMSSQAHLGEKFFSLGKSADATKWCQRNDSSKFAAVISPLLPYEFREFFIFVMWLWKKKRISFPIQFAANFQANKKTISNPIYNRMKKEFFQGSGIFEQQQCNKMMIRSGMMQGILHYTSSLTHAVVQEVIKKLQCDYLRRRSVEAYITIVQGSDDSAEVISLKGDITKPKLRLATTMLHWKEQVSRFFSIYTSRAKSSIGTLDLVEYNSEWMIRSNVVKPTFRWVSACMETTVTERFIDRVRINYNVSSQVLEGGGKVLEVATLQLCQAWMHYLLIGLHTSDLACLAANELASCLDPALGFYPLDSDYCAGITGVEFQLFKLFKQTNFGVGMSFANIHDPNIYTTEDESPDMSVSKSLRSVKIKFSNMKLWQNQMRQMDVPDLEAILQKVEDNPYLIYARHKSWEESKYSIYLKMFQPGVKESLSRHSATARIMSASAYILSRPCVSIYTENGPDTMSLIAALFYYKKKREGSVKLTPDEVFTHASEYSEVLAYIDDLEDKSTLIMAKFRTRTKQKIVVFERSIDDVPLIDLCKKKWFGLGKTPLSKRQFETFWQEAKLKYPFLRDTRTATKTALGMHDLELKNFLESVTNKPRNIVLLDTSAKSASLFSSITRIFWNGVKIVIPGKSDEEESSYSLRSKVFSVLTSWYSDDIKKRKLKSMIKNSTLLGNKLVPSRVKQLRVFYRWFNGVDKGSIIRYISEERLGSVGFFTARQKGWGKERKGYGEWRGKCLDNSVVIKMQGNVCTLIEIDKLTNLKLLGPTLLELVNSFSLVPQERIAISEHWLSPSGKLLGGAGKNNFIPVKVKPSLIVDIIDQISEYNWNWEIIDNRIRLIAEIGPNQKITILSDSFTSRDWDPEYKIHDDILLSHWSSGTPIPLDIIENELKSVIKPLPGSILKAVRTKYTLNTASNWNLGKFVDVINSMMVREVIEPLSDESDEIDDSEFDLDFLINEMNVEKIDSNDWFKADQFLDTEDFDYDLFGMDNIDDEGLDTKLQLFSQNFPVDSFIASDKRTMSPSNLTLDNLNLLVRIVLDLKSFREAVNKFKRQQESSVGGLLGIILSFFCNRCCLDVPFEYPEDIQDLTKDSILATEKLLGTSLEGNMEHVTSTIEHLEEVLKTAPINLRPKYESLLSRYMNIKLKLKNTPINDGDLEALSQRDFCLKLKPILLEENKIPESYALLPVDVFLEVMRAELDTHLDLKHKLGELNQYQHSTYRESIRKPYVTSLFLDSFSWVYDVGVNLRGYITEGSVEYFWEDI